MKDPILLRFVLEFLKFNVSLWGFNFFYVRHGVAVRLRCKGVNPDDHPVKKELVSASECCHFLF